MTAVAKTISAITHFPSGLLKFIRQAKDELKKVSWPSRETTLKYTLIVVISSLAMGLLTGGIDYLLQQILERFVL